MRETKGLSISSTFTVNQRQQYNCQPPLSDKLVRVQLTSHLDNLLRLAGSSVAPDKSFFIEFSVLNKKRGSFCILPFLSVYFNV